MEEVVAADLPELVKNLNELSSKCGEVSELVTGLKKKVLSSEVERENGLSLLELKHNLMLSYVINVVHLMLLKVKGESLVDQPVVHRLTEIRTIIEKIRPIDHKLRYQVDKLIQAATTGLAASANDPLHFRPRPNELVSKVMLEEGGEGVESEDSDGDRGMLNQQLYVPPKVVAVPYAEDKGQGSKMKHKKTHGSVLQELKDELSDAPLEVKTSEVGLRRKRDLQEEMERERFEEDQMIRVARKRHRNSGRGINESLSEVADFSGFESLINENDSETLGRPGKRKKMKKKKGTKKRRFKRR